MCDVVFRYANPLMMGNHLRNQHDLVYSSGVLSRAMFLSHIGLSEAVEVLKDFNRRDMRLSLVTTQLMQQQDRAVVKCSRMVQTEDDLEIIITRRSQDVQKFKDIWRSGITIEDEKDVILTSEQFRIFEE